MNIGYICVTAREAMRWLDMKASTFYRKAKRSG